MHDHNGTPLKVGDKVMVEFLVKEVHATEEYCNLTLESVYGRLPDDKKEDCIGLNSHVVVLSWSRR